MRCFFVLSTLCNMLSICMLMIILGQREEAKLLRVREEQQRAQALYADAELIDRRFHRGNVQKLVDQVFKKQEALDVEVNDLTADKNWKLNTNNNCWEVEAIMKKEVGIKEWEYDQLRESHKREWELWQVELQDVRLQAERPSEICNYVRQSRVAQALCAPGRRE